MTFTATDVLGCESCLLVANSATVTKIAEFQRISNAELLNHIRSVHIEQQHDTRNARLRELVKRDEAVQAKLREKLRPWFQSAS